MQSVVDYLVTTLLHFLGENWIRFEFAATFLMKRSIPATLYGTQAKLKPLCRSGE